MFWIKLATAIVQINFFLKKSYFIEKRIVKYFKYTLELRIGKHFIKR